MTNISETIYKEIASLHIGHSLKNRQYDNILFHKMIQNMGDLKNKNILEFGCGHGHYANFLLENGGENIYGVDIDEEAIKTANFNNKKGGKFVHLSKNGVERVTDFGIQFDEVYSMYVYETIKDKEVIEKIFLDIFQVIKEGGKFQFIIGNLEEFYGKKCLAFEFPKNEKYLTLKDGDPYIARLNLGEGTLDVQDFFYSQGTLLQILKKVGFSDIVIEKYELVGNEYDGMINEKEFVPSVVFVAKKNKSHEYVGEIANFWSIFIKESNSYKYMLTDPMIKKVEEYFGSIKGIVGLDYGCGDGSVTKDFAESGAEMIGLDISKDLILNAKKQYPNINFIENIETINDDFLDFVFFRFSLCTMDENTYKDTLRNVYQKLKKGGILLIGDENWEECIGKETKFEYYPTVENLADGDKVKTILKVGGKKFSRSLIKGKDYEEIVDHFRTQDFTKNKLIEAGFKGVSFSFPDIPVNPNWDIWDEKDHKIYKITIAQK